jgi:hypothetical protein
VISVTQSATIASILRCNGQCLICYASNHNNNNNNNKQTNKQIPVLNAEIRSDQTPNAQFHAANDALLAGDTDRPTSTSATLEHHRHIPCI